MPNYEILVKYPDVCVSSMGIYYFYVDYISICIQLRNAIHLYLFCRLAIYIINSQMN